MKKATIQEMGVRTSKAAELLAVGHSARLLRPKGPKYMEYLGDKREELLLLEWV